MFQVDGVCDGELRPLIKVTQDDNCQCGVFSLDFFLGVFPGLVIHCKTLYVNRQNPVGP